MTPSQLPDPSLPWPVPMDAVLLIADNEQGPKGGPALKAYKCPAGVWTNGWGETEGVFAGQVISKAKADTDLCNDLAARCKKVTDMCNETPNPNQLGALVSLAYNIGLRDDKRKAGLYYTSVLRLHNAGDFDGAARAFDLINKYRDPKTGQLTESSGLTRRRKAEAALYLTPDPDAVMTPPTPQIVVPESNVVTRPLSVTGMATAAGGVLTVISQLGDQVNGVLAKLHEAAETIGSPA